MSAKLRSPKARVGLGVAGGLLLFALIWVLLVSPQRSKAVELGVQVDNATNELAQKRSAVANPAARVTVKPGDIYRLTKALPNDAEMAGILLDVDRLARRNDLEFRSIAPSPKVLANGYLQQPLAVTVEGRFGDVSRFLGDFRSLVSVRKGRLDARGRLYSVSQVDMGTSATGKKFPIVAASVTLNAYSFSAPVPTQSEPPSSTSTDTSSGTVAAGATP